MFDSNRLKEKFRPRKNLDRRYSLPQQYDVAKNTLPEFAQLTSQEANPTLDEIPDNWEEIKEFYAQREQQPLELVELLDKLLGKRDKFVVDILEARLKIIANNNLKKQFPDLSAAKKSFLSSPQKYLPELLVRSQKLSLVPTLANCLLNEKWYELVKGDVLHQLCIVFWQQQPDETLLLSLISPPVVQHFDNQDQLKLASLLLHPELEIPSSAKVDIRETVKTLSSDDREYLIVTAKYDIVSKLTSPEETQRLLNICELLGLSQEERQQILAEVPIKACNIKLLKKYISSEGISDQKNEELLNKLLELTPSSEEVSDLESYYLNLLVNLARTDEDEKLTFYKEKIVSQGHIDSSSFFAKLMKRFEKLISSTSISSASNILIRLTRSELFSNYDINKLKSLLIETPIVQEVVSLKIEQIRQQFSSELEKLKNEIKDEIAGIKNEIKDEIQELERKIISKLTEPREKVRQELQKSKATSKPSPSSVTKVPRKTAKSEVPSEHSPVTKVQQKTVKGEVPAEPSPVTKVQQKTVKGEVPAEPSTLTEVEQETVKGEVPAEPSTLTEVEQETDKDGVTREEPPIETESEETTNDQKDSKPWYLREIPNPLDGFLNVFVSKGEKNMNRVDIESG